jgi:hypothetical protein
MPMKLLDEGVGFSEFNVHKLKVDLFVAVSHG